MRKSDIDNSEMENQNTMVAKRPDANSRQILEKQIKFQLSDLSATNAHHEFEHICRRITRARICSNILPSTGPVSGGGDGGRDYQTYKSYLQKEIGNSIFLSLISDSLLVFACSIGATQIPQKIKDDVKTICSNGLKVEGIHFFTPHNLQAAKRFELQTWAKNKHDVDLEIHDLQAITEHLSQVDTFWIASEYLGIPSDLCPQSYDPNWYETLRKVYEEKLLVINFAEFEDIKRGLRYSTWEKKEDISFWIERFNKYPALSEKSKLSRMVTYEICVASLRGLETLAGLEERINSYFEQVPCFEIPELGDAQIFSTYMVGAKNQAVFEFSDEDLFKWRNLILKRIQYFQSQVLSDSATAQLLRIAGFHSVFKQDLYPDLQLQESLDYWEQLETLIKSLPFYPVESFSRSLETIQDLVGANTRLEKLSVQINTICSARLADSSVAEKDWNRATSYLEKSLYLEAANSLHRAVTGFLNHESIQDSVISLIALSKLYSEIGLHYAAKYYAMCAFSISYTARHEVFPKYLAEAASILANLEYGFGCWHSFITRAKLFFLAYSAFKPDPNNTYLSDTESRNVIMHLGLLEHVTQRMVLEHRVISSSLEKCGLSQDDRQRMKEIVEDVWGKRTQIELKAEIVSQLSGPPYCDGGPTRTIVWHQFGLQIEIVFKNNYMTTAAAEQFAFAMQVVLVAIGSKELCLVPGLVRVNFSLSDTPEISTSESDNSKCVFKVEFPETYTSEDVLGHLLASVSSVINAKSALPTDQFLKHFETQMKEDLLGKLFVGSSYIQQFCNSIEIGEYETPERISIGPIFLPSEIEKKLHQTLAYNSEPLTSAVDDEDRIRIRYAKSLKALKITLPRLNSNSEFQKAIESLKEKGWLDWHILQGLANLIINYKTRKEVGEDDSGRKYEEVMLKYFNREETKEDVSCPDELVTEAQIEMMISISAMSSFKSLGLELKSSLPQISDIMEFLKTKCGYSKDIPHDDVWRT